MDNSLKTIVISATFSADFLEQTLEYFNTSLDLGLSFFFVSYNQVFQQLISPGSLMNKNHNGLNVILIRFIDWLRFRSDKAGEPGNNPVMENPKQYLDSIYDSFTTALKTYSVQNRCQTLILICPSSAGDGDAEGQAKVFAEYRDALLDYVKAFASIKCLVVEDYHEAYEVTDVYDATGDRMGHIPYCQDYLHLPAALIIRYYTGLHLSRKKVIAVDCDNTLWNGICGETEPGCIDVNGYAGKLQQFLVDQCRQGMLICLCSKNREEDVWAVFNANPGMPLKKEHIVAFRINWEPKSDNLQSLSVELNLGLDSFVFIDDNEIECAEVNIRHPEIFTIHWPLPGADPVQMLSQLWIFDHFSVTEEDTMRTLMYQADIARKKASEKSTDWESFLGSLNLEVDISPIIPATAERTAQLTNRTNQFNFATIRRTPGDIAHLMQDTKHICYTVKAGDRYGFYGIIGVIILFKEKDCLTVDTFLLSCRVLGRGIEHRMIRRIAELAEGQHQAFIRILFRPSEKNAPAKKFIDWLTVEYSGSRETDGEILFKTERLVQCRCTKYTDDEFLEKKPVKTKQQAPVKTDLLSFWLKNNTIRKLSEQVSLFRKGSHNPLHPAGNTGQEAVARIKEVFITYTGIAEEKLTKQLLLESLSLESKDIVSITAELHRYFGNVFETLLFECRTFGDVCDYIQGNSKASNPCENSRQAAEKAGKIISGAEKSQKEEPVPCPGDIAVIGISCRYPDADSIHELWENLCKGKCSLREIPEERWDNSLFFSPHESEPFKSYSKWGGFLKNIDKFDAQFFNSTPRQAALMDPQQRLFLEVVWNLLEDAGYNPENFNKNTGVFAGIIASDYSLYENWNSLHTVEGFRNCEYYQIPNRISYFFDFRGPSIAIDTACSSSGTALALACESLLTGSCEYAVAGGINLILHPSRYIQYCHAGILSRDRLCRPFSEDATGTVIGEGVGALLLKPYNKAVADNDHIWGVIKGWAVNSGGRTAGFTVPNPHAQSEVILRAIQKSGIDPASVSYVEAHGTGTPLGDPIEVKGLDLAFRRGTKYKNVKNQYCSLGSIKANIGHLESGAAVAGIIKILLQMKFGTLVPSLYAERENSRIDFTASPFKIQHDKTPWIRPVLTNKGKTIQYPLRAGISTFGAGGSNAHFIIEEAPGRGKQPASGKKRKQRKHLVLFSAQNRAQLLAYLHHMAAFLGAYVCSGNGLPGYTIENIAFTLLAGRKEMKCRIAFLVDSPQELRCRIDEYIHNACKTVQGSRDIFYDDGEEEGNGNTSAVMDGSNSSNPQVMDNESELEQCAIAWVRGGEIKERNMLYYKNPCRLSLPVYPFDGTRYWMNEYSIEKSMGKKESGFLSKEGNNGISLSLFHKIWKKVPANRETAAFIPGDIIIIGGTMALVGAVLNFFDGIGMGHHRISIVTTWKDSFSFFEKPGTRVYGITAYNYSQCYHVFSEFTREKKRIGCILNFIPFQYTQGNLLKQSFYSVFGVLKQLLKSSGACSTKFFCFYPGGIPGSIPGSIPGNIDDAYPWWGALTGLGITIREENPDIDFRLVKIAFSHPVDDPVFLKQAVTALKGELCFPSCGHEIFYDADTKWTSYFEPIHTAVKKRDWENEIPLQENGCYIITGGLGSLGFSVASFLASCIRCSIVLCGRGAPAGEMPDKIRKLKEKGCDCIYIKADISRSKDTYDLIGKAKKRYGRINGIFHCAGVTRDSFLIKKDLKEIHEVLAPKVKGTVFLDNAVENLPLDFFVLFSSLSGVLGNHGQADYAYANSFLDHFCEWRNNLVKQGRRNGITISINWPYWQDGGMKMNDTDSRFFTETTGLLPLPTETGIAILKQVLALRITQAIPCYGNAERFSSVLNRENNKSMEGEGMSCYAVDSDEPDESLFRRFVKDFLLDTLSEVSHINPGDIKDDTHFETLGFDSIMVRHFSHKVEQQIGRISKTLLFECQSLCALLDYFLIHYRTQLADYYRKAKKTVINPAARETYVCDQEKTRNFSCEPAMDIAIVGMSGCFPQAGNLNEFWLNLKNGRDCVTTIPEDRWDNKKYFSPDKNESKNGKYYCRWGGFMDSVYDFDPLFFSIAPKDARAMDPQERLFLKLAWTALEDAGYNRESLGAMSCKGDTLVIGVFVGVTTNDYQLLGAENLGAGNVIGRSLSWSIANRVSYVFNLKGPSMPVDSACSSALLALHLACESIKRGECDAAITGAVNLFLHPFKFILNSHQRMLSAKGRCFTFSADADGFVPAEGAGAFFLKPLHRAWEDKDHIYAVIKSTAVNHTGKTNGYMVPNPDTQAEVIRMALKAGTINPRTITYLEAHGTGTILGDPVEITGLVKAFKGFCKDNEQQDTGYCSIGSVKANIGHAEAAAGAASLAKVILQFQNRWIVPALYAGKLNPEIDLKNSPFFIQTTGGPWKRPIIKEGNLANEYPLRAGISSFGAGGVNVHVIVEEHKSPPVKEREQSHGPHLVVLSAMKTNQLKEYALKLLHYIDASLSGHNGGSNPALLDDIAYTLKTGREAFRERLALVVSDIAELKQKLTAFLDDEYSTDGLFTRDEQAAGSPAAGNHLSDVARKWVNGCNVDFKQFYKQGACRRLSLPTYPFNKEHFSIGSRQRKHKPAVDNFTMTGTMEKPGPGVFEFTLVQSVEACEYLKAHVLFGKAVLSGPTQLAMLFEAVYRSLSTTRVRLNHMSFIAPLVVAEGDPVVLKISLAKTAGKGYTFRFKSRSLRLTDGGWLVHSIGMLESAEENDMPACGGNDAAGWEPAGMQTIDVQSFYEKLEKMGYRFNDSFKCITDIKTKNGFSFSKISNRAEKDSYVIMDPGIIDSCIQVLLPTLPGEVIEAKPHSIYVPVFLSGFSLFKPFSDEIYCRGKKLLWDDKRETFLGSLLIRGNDGTIYASIDKFRLKRVDSGKLMDTAITDNKSLRSVRVD